ncbi:MAG: hypothetical protein U0P81_07655 [Holophagaceae bacterium]
MKGRPDCPQCRGAGVLVDPDPLKPVAVCGCTREVAVAERAAGIPARYAGATFESFWEWWKLHHPRPAVLEALDQARALLQPPLKETLSAELASKLDHIVHKCGRHRGEDGLEAWKTLRPAREPQGYALLQSWARSDRTTADLWWIDGPPGSGRSTLAAAALKAWCARTGAPGAFVSVRELSQRLKDVYYDVRSWQNVDFLSERDLMAPFQAAPCLVLDDWDRMDSDLRVVRALAQLLDHRYAHARPTLLTAARGAYALQQLESYPPARLEDASLLHRLAHAQRVELRPVLQRLLDSARAD